jgi:hypothetical protein
MDKRTGAERHPRGGIDWLGEYRPQGIDPIVWGTIGSWVVGCTEQLGLGEGPGARRAVRVLGRLAAWSVREGLPLDGEVVLDPEMVERFVAVALTDDRSRATYRAVLRRVGPKLTSKAPWQARPVPLSRRQVARPYTWQDLGWLRMDALVQPTPGRLRAARALLALGAGAGLDGRWVARVGAGDVRIEDGVVLVAVGEPSARVVPVLAVWEDEVLQLAHSAGDEFLVGGQSRSKNRAGALASSLVVANGHPRFSTARLRSTWLVTHLALGTRLPELARAAGLHGVTVPSDLLEFVPALDEVEATRLLRGVR